MYQLTTVIAPQKLAPKIKTSWRYCWEKRTRTMLKTTAMTYDPPRLNTPVGIYLVYILTEEEHQQKALQMLWNVCK